MPQISPIMTNDESRCIKDLNSCVSWVFSPEDTLQLFLEDAETLVLHHPHHRCCHWNDSWHQCKNLYREIFHLKFLFKFTALLFAQEDDHSVARWIMALDSTDVDFGPLPESSSSEEEDSIPSLESIDSDSRIAAEDQSPTARVFIPSINKIRTIVDILKSVGEVVIPVIVEKGEASAGVSAGSEILEQIKAGTPEDIVAYRTHGIMLLQNAKKEIGNFGPTGTKIF